MTIRQLYYTSCRHPLTGRTGFQVKAESPGIAPGTLEALQRVLAYRLPPPLLEQPAAAHPVALRYTPLAGGEAALVCIHSSGLDEFDRPGNYFAHAVLGPAGQIARVYPPITYWNSPFWASRDDTPRTELPVSADFTAEAAFDYDAVWSFLDEKPRRGWFRALLNAVVDHTHARRPIVIVDSPANTALWIYAVSLALPSRFRPMLSFATYHHDPLAAPFVIAGTTPEGIVARPGGPPRFTLDTASGSVDEAPLSPFAAYICDHFTADGYEAEILEFLDWAEARDDRAAAITHLLDDLTLFYLATRRGSSIGTASLERAAEYVVEDAARTAGAYAQDAADLRAAAAIYGGLLTQSGAAEHLDSYQRTLTALAQVEADITDTASDAVRLYLGCVLDRRAALAASLGRFIATLYPADVVADALNQPELLEHLAQLLRADDTQQVLLFWQQVGPHLRFDGAGQDAIVDAMLTTFAALQPAPPPDPLALPPDAAALLGAFAAAMGHHYDLALRTAHFFQQRHPGVSVLEWVYGALAAPLSLRQRAKALWRYWDAFADAADLRTYEIHRDLRAISDSAALGVRLAEWHETLTAAGHAPALESVLQAGWTRPGLDRQRFALAALSHDPLAAGLDAGWRGLLLDAALSGAAIALPDAATADLYSRLIANPRLPLTTAQRAAVEGALALHSGRFPSGTAVTGLRDRLAALDAGAYRAEAEQLLRRFFTAQTHPDLVRALYARPHRDTFWALYWERFGAALLDEQRSEDTAAIMDVWFARSGALVSDAPYALPEFFVQLPVVLDGLRASRRYTQVGRAFEAQLAAYDWYALLHKTLAGRASGRGLLGGLFDR
jgi:hypothetical protein